MSGTSGAGVSGTGAADATATDAATQAPVRMLLVGEGDFTFTLALTRLLSSVQDAVRARASLSDEASRDSGVAVATGAGTRQLEARLAVPWRITATSFDSHAALRAKYRDIRSVLGSIQSEAQRLDSACAPVTSAQVTATSCVALAHDVDATRLSDSPAAKSGAPYVHQDRRVPQMAACVHGCRAT